MSTYLIGNNNNKCKFKTQTEPVTELKEQPDYRRFERLKAEISPELNAHEYTNACRRVIVEALI